MSDMFDADTFRTLEVPSQIPHEKVNSATSGYGLSAVTDDVDIALSTGATVHPDGSVTTSWAAGPATSSSSTGDYTVPEAP